MASDGARFGGRRAVVTGAGGLIGARCCAELVTAGAQVVGLDLSPAAAERVRASGAEFELVDVTDREALGRAMKGAALVVHTAARLDDGRDMDDFVRVNVGGTAAVLAAARAAGVARVVHLSSVVVYGYESEAEQDEGAALRTVGIPYIDTKSASERIARRAGAVVVRPGDVYGPRSVPWVIRPVGLMRSRLLGLPRAEGWMLPVYVDDLVEAILLALERGEPGAAYAVWDGSSTSFADYFARLARAAGTAPPQRLPEPVLRALGAAVESVDLRLGRAPRITGRAITFVTRRGRVSNRRAREELGWEPRVDLEEGIRRTGEWLREQPV